MQRYFFAAVLALVLMLASACNVYDWTHQEGDSSSVSVLLSDGRAAQSNGDYALAATIYMKVLSMDSNNSTAMVGYSTAILYRDVELVDIPELMNSIYSIDPANTNDFLNDIVGRSGMTAAEYKSNVMATVSNACWWRAPVNGIDRATGLMNTNTNGDPLATASDGVIPATDRNSLLNYIIAKSVHVALYVQAEFEVYGNLSSGIDVNAYTNTFSTVSNQESFTNWHIVFTNDIMTLSNAYSAVTNIVLGTGQNSSILNLIGTADGFITMLSNAEAAGSVSTGLFTEARDAVSSLKTSLGELSSSLTNASTGVPAGFDAISSFRQTVESNAQFIGWWY